MFFAYNNGVAATASDAVVKLTSGGLRLIGVKDLQIVNGGQTTASLAAALREGGADLTSIFVQMKLSVVPPERSGEVIPFIARYANSQNKVSDADFFSNHDFHRRMEVLSRQTWAPAVAGAQHETHWFYERARGQYVNEQARMTSSEKKRFLLQNPKKQLVSKTDVAKVENAWRRKPNVVCLGAQKNFTQFTEYVESEWDKSESNFNVEYFKALIAKVILFSETERIVTGQTWYAGGYRAQIVAYTVSLLAEVIATKAESWALDLGAIWARQGCSESLRVEIARLAAVVHGVIANPDSGYANVTEWCKREQCWKRVCALNVGLSSAVRRDLIAVDQAAAIRKRAAKDQGERNVIDRVMDVVSLGAEFWIGLRNWGSARDLWTADEERLLALAAKRNFVPSDRQAGLLFSLRERASEEGFVK